MRSILAFGLSLCTFTASASLPTEAPDVAIVVTSCHEVVSVILVMPDGKKLLFDKDSGEDVEKVKTLASRSRTGVSIYEVGCYRLDPVVV
jgi:hypothetical protein